MKKFISILFVTFLIACSSTSKDGLTKEEENVLITKINKFNEKQYFQFFSDSNREINYYKIELIKTTDLPRTKIDEFAQTHIESWVVNTYNKPYKIEKDYKLTLKSYLSYCKTMNLDSKTYIDILLK